MLNSPKIFYGVYFRTDGVFYSPCYYLGHLLPGPVVWLTGGSHAAASAWCRGALAHVEVALHWSTPIHPSVAFYNAIGVHWFFVFFRRAFAGNQPQQVLSSIHPSRMWSALMNTATARIPKKGKGILTHVHTWCVCTSKEGAYIQTASIYYYLVHCSNRVVLLVYYIYRWFIPTCIYIVHMVTWIIIWYQP